MDRRTAIKTLTGVAALAVVAPALAATPETNECPKDHEYVAIVLKVSTALKTKEGIAEALKQSVQAELEKLPGWGYCGMIRVRAEGLDDSLTEKDRQDFLAQVEEAKKDKDFAVITNYEVNWRTRDAVIVLNGMAANVAFKSQSYNWLVTETLRNWFDSYKFEPNHIEFVAYVSAPKKKQA